MEWEKYVEKKCEKQVRSPINKRLGENRNWNFFSEKKRNINKYKQGVFCCCWFAK